jgi:2-methylcitrate dehydratase PrpD
MTYTAALADFACCLSPADVPADVVHEARRVLLDSVGCGVAGSTTEPGRIAAELMGTERGPLEATIVRRGPASVASTAFANTVLINALDHDAYGPEGHVAPVAVASALALAEATDATWDDLVGGLLAGLEIGGRIGSALRRFGLGATRSVGAVRGHGHCVFAAAAAAGRVLHLTPRQMAHAFGIAGYSANVPTLRKFFASNSPPMTKYDHLAAMSQAGIQAVLLAERGFTGDTEVLESDIGFWRFSGSDGCDWHVLADDLGIRWSTREMHYKPVPALLTLIPAIEVIRRMLAEHALRIEDIQSIEVRLDRPIGFSVPEVPETPLQAALNEPYTVAAGVFDVRPYRTWYEPYAFRSQPLLDLARKISFGAFSPGEVQPLANYWEGWSPVRVRVRAGGRKFEGTQNFLRQVTDEDLAAKFSDNVDGLLEAEAAERLVHELLTDQSGVRARELALSLSGERLGQDR